MNQAQLETFVIYENPKDFPGKFVLRKWTSDREGVSPQNEPMAVVDSLEDARKALPQGLYNLKREPGDDPVIREVWL